MSDKIRILTDRIAERLAAVGLSEREASLKATGKPDAIRYIRTRRAMPSAARLLKLSNVLHASAAYLLGEQDEIGWDQVEVVSEVYGLATETAINDHIASGADAGNPAHMGILVFHAEPGATRQVIDLNGNALLIQPTCMTSVVIEFSPPPRFGWQFEETTLAYYTTESVMSPAFERGNKIFMQPEVIPNVGDYVAVKLKAANEVQLVILRRLVGISQNAVTLRQYDPPAVFQIEKSEIDYIAHALSYADVV